MLHIIIILFLCNMRTYILIIKYIRNTFLNNNNKSSNVETSLQSETGANRINMFWLTVYSNVWKIPIDDRSRPIN